MNKLVVKGRNTSKAVAIDIEKTRPGPKSNPKAHTIEIGMVKLSLCQRPGGKVLCIQDHFSTLVRPPVPINNTPDHGIIDADVVDAPTLASIADRITSFLDGAHMLVSHNCSAEYRLFEELAAAGYASSIRFVDTKEMAKVVDKQCFEVHPKTLTLAALTNKFRCCPAEAHRALDDAIACANLYSIYRFLMRRFGYRKWEGFRELEGEVKRFTYTKEFVTEKSAKNVRPECSNLKCRIPEHELRILQKMYWA